MVQAAATANISAPEKISVELTVNNVTTELKVAPWTTLLDALREHLDLTGTKRAVTTASAARVPSSSTVAVSIHAWPWPSCRTARR